MRWHFSRLLHIAAVAAATVSLWGSAAPVARGHWGHACWGHGFYRPYGFGYGFGAFGLGLGLGYGLGYGLGGYYAPYYGGYVPYYSVYGPAALYPPVVVAANPATPPSVSASAPASNQPPPDNAAHLQLIVPDEAEVWFAGARIAREGRVREFVSPPLNPGQVYNYQIVVRYSDAAGKPVEDKRDIRVRANDWFSIDFTRPPPAGKPTPVPPPSP
jgi:uncharacterized protein (TIGR03000 family)